MTKEQWQAIKNSDKRYDGQFYYALKSAGKVCRPSCRKRSYDPTKVILFDTLEEALARGFQPCERCRPDQADWADAKHRLAQGAETLIRANYTEKFSLDALAGALHVDKSYLLRTFKDVTGTTPLVYHNRVRCEAARDMLTRPELSISYIALAVGYATASHFSQVFRKITGVTPSAYRRGYLNSLDE